MTHVTCRLTAKNPDQLQNPTLCNRVWATFTLFRQSARWPPTLRPTQLTWAASLPRLLPSAFTIAICYYYSARLPVLVLHRAPSLYTANLVVRVEQSDQRSGVTKAADWGQSGQLPPFLQPASGTKQSRQFLVANNRKVSLIKTAQSAHSRVAML